MRRPVLCSQELSLYHKLNGIDGNKKPIDFTMEERYQCYIFR